MAKVDKNSDVTESVESVDLEDIFNSEEEPTSNGNYNLDSIDLEMDIETVARLESSLSLETGTYTWKQVENNPIVSINFSADDRDSKDIKAKDGKGRCFINLSGTVINIKTKKEGRFQFGMSPDERLFPNGDQDTLTKNYGRFSAYYFRVTDERGKNPSKVTALAASTRHVMYITKSKNGDNYLNKVQERVES